METVHLDTTSPKQGARKHPSPHRVKEREKIIFPFLLYRIMDDGVLPLNL